MPRAARPRLELRQSDESDGSDGSAGSGEEGAVGELAAATPGALFRHTPPSIGPSTPAARARSVRDHKAAAPPPRQANKSIARARRGTLALGGVNGSVDAELLAALESTPDEADTAAALEMLRNGALYEEDRAPMSARSRAEADRLQLAQAPPRALPGGQRPRPPPVPSAVSSGGTKQPTPEPAADSLPEWLRARGSEPHAALCETYESVDELIQFTTGRRDLEETFGLAPREAAYLWAAIQAERATSPLRAGGAPHGAITIAAGFAKEGNGAEVTVSAGSTQGNDAKGGTAAIEGGAGTSSAWGRSTSCGCA